MTDSKFARRAIVTGLGAGVALTAAAAHAETPAAPQDWKPTLDPQDAWMELPGQHRMVFDAVSTKGAGEALMFANNYLHANKTGYGLEAKDLATIVILRHQATMFAYDDTIWAKYGALLSGLVHFHDPKTKKPATRNVLLTAEGEGPEAVSIPMLAKAHVHFAVCGAATAFFAGYLAKHTRAKTDAVHAELEAHLVPNGHMVPAGIVAVNRTQERGYAFAYVG